MSNLRKIISIDENLCNGCGNCITGCAEGALKLVNGKAKLVKDDFCDGLGDCIGTCPTGALKIVERKANNFDQNATRAHVAQQLGAAGLAQLDRVTTQRVHKSTSQHSCPGARNIDRSQGTASLESNKSDGGYPMQAIPSELQQWPVQLHLVQPTAPYFKNRELVILSTCSPVASADIHWRFLRGRSVVLACPKLDHTEPYLEKLAAILAEPTISRVIVVRMSVPCCGGLTAIATQAHQSTGRSDLVLDEVTVELNGDITTTRFLSECAPCRH